MTVEHRFVVGLKDITAVTFECKKCGARLSVKVDVLASLTPHQCPSCTHDWVSDSTTTGRFFTAPLMLLLRALPPSLNAQEDASNGMRILFEFDDPSRVLGQEKE